MTNLNQDSGFDQDQWSNVDLVIDKFRDTPGALIPVLEEVQNITGYLPEQMQRHIAFRMDIPVSTVYGVVTFYSFFTMVPRGRNQIRVCTGTACHVRGANKILEQLVRELGILPGQVTPDKRFRLDSVRCLGCCALAPVILINDDVHPQVKPAQIKKILTAYK